MSEIKWIKLTVNVFDDEKFDAIKTLPDSNDIQLIWVKLLCLAGTCNEHGFLMLTKEIPYTDEMMASRFHMDVGVIQRAMSIFQKLNMIEIVDNVYMVSNWLKYQSGDRLEELQEKHRESQRRYREKQKFLLGQKQNSDITGDVTNDVTPSISYSFNNKSNIDNFNHLITKDIYKDSSYIKDNPKLLKSIEDWLGYKDNKKPKSQHHYDTEQGMSKLLTSIVNKDKDFGTEYVMECIDNTIANNYQGIVWKEGRQGKTYAGKTDTSAIDNYRRGS